MWAVEGVVADRGVQGQDASVGQGEDGLAQDVFPVVFALVVGTRDGDGAQRGGADRNMARLTLLLPS